MPFDDAMAHAAGELLEVCRVQGVKLATAESCTGGLIAGLLTAIAGSSDVVERGFVTYTNEAKHEMLGVPVALFDTVGAVSEDVARAMAEGAVLHSRADAAVSATGVAGPGGGTETKPVGLVHIAAARAGRETLHERHVFEGDRTAVRRQSVVACVALLRRVVET
ncbi:MAG: CinA family protein [Rhodospirillaceae bacterium]|jgi:nicotinamide-nucleotide amidase|nr:CinA family protein [Rhodospirillaceae bacterium]